MSRRLLAVALVAAGAVAVSCSTIERRGDVTEVSVPADVTANTAVTGTTESTATTEVTEVTDIAYLTLGGERLALDVLVPAGEGPWPVLVSFHGNSAEARDSPSNTVIAEEAAARGILVFSPSWIPSDAFPLMIDDIEELGVAASCAVAVAQELAPDYGGDPSRTAVHGFSAGAGPAHSVAIDPARTPIPGCETDAVPAPVVAVALSDGEYFFHSAAFDGAFAATPTEMRDRVAAWVDPDRWPADLVAEYWMWAAAERTAPRVIGDPSDETGWLAQRDPTGNLRADLDRLGLLDDDQIDDRDSAVLLADRLAGAGIEVTLEILPGGHQTADKATVIVDEIVRMLADA
jgi:acetyl esterase/lipase